MADINVRMTSACSGERSGHCHWISDREKVRQAIIWTTDMKMQIYSLMNKTTNVLTCNQWVERPFQYCRCGNCKL